MSANIEAPPAQYVRLDLFPAVISTKDPANPLPNTQLGGVLDSKRVIVTDTKVLIFADSPTGPILLHDWNLVDITGKSTVGWTIETEDRLILVRRSGGCGCGSRLRGLRPYPGLPYQPVSQ